MNAIQIFHQLHLEYLIVSSLRSLDVLFLKNFHGWNRNWDSFVKQRAFLLFHGFLGVSNPIPTKNAVVFQKLPTGYTWISH